MADMVPILQAFGQQGQSPFAQPDQTNLLGQANTALQNPLLLQYISALGGSMGGTVAKGLDATNQQNIKAQSYMKMLQKMMAGGAKVGMDAESTTIKMPTKDAHTIMGVQGDEGTGQAGGFGNDRSFVGGGTSSTPQPKDPASVMGAVLGGNVNPTPSPLGNFSASDLAGLTPQDIASALTGKFTQEKITQEGVNSQFDNAYKLAQINRMNQPTREKTTAEIENYQYAVKNGYKGTFEEWKNVSDTATQKDYEYAVKQGYTGSYKDWRLEIAKASATNVNIGDKVNQAEAMQDVKDRRYFSDPKGGLSKDIEDHMNSMPVMMQTARHKLGTKEHSKVSAKIREDYFKKKLADSGGEIVSGKVVGKDSVWTIRWRDGKTSEVRYGN